MSGQPSWSTWDLIKSDLRASMPDTVEPGLKYWLHLLLKVIVNPQARVMILFRVSNALARHHLMPLAMWLRGRAIRGGGAELHPLAQIGPYCYLVHSTGVVISAYVNIGEDARIHQGVTIGAPRRTFPGGIHGWTKVGDHVTFGTHAVVMGAVTIGDHAVIGANAVVTSDVPSLAIVGGVPARVLRYRDLEAEASAGE